MNSNKIVKSLAVAALVAASLAQPALAEPMSKEQRAAETQSWLNWILSAHGQALNWIFRSS